MKFFHRKKVPKAVIENHLFQKIISSFTECLRKNERGVQGVFKEFLEKKFY